MLGVCVCVCVCGAGAAPGLRLRTHVFDAFGHVFSGSLAPGRRQILERRPPTARGTRTIVAHGATFFIRADRPDCCGAVGTTPAPRKSCQMGAVRRVGSRAPLQRCYNVFGGLATAKGATATDLKLCRRSAPHATRRGRSGQPPNSARTCLSTHKNGSHVGSSFKSV